MTRYTVVNKGGADAEEDEEEEAAGASGGAGGAGATAPAAAADPAAKTIIEKTTRACFSRPNPANK